MKRTLLIAVVLVVVAVIGIVLFGDKFGAPATPEGAVSSMVGAVMDGRVGDAYKSLPASYKKDMEEVAKAFGNKMDADIWKEAQALIAELGDLVAAKADVLVGVLAKADVLVGVLADVEETDADKKEMSDRLMKAALLKKEMSDRLMKAAPLLKKLGSELSLDMFKSGNVGKILESSGIAGIAASLGDAATSKIKSVSGNDDGSVLAVLVDEDGEETEITFLKVEDAWVPEDMAEGWKEGVAEALKSINEMEFDPKTKEQFLGMSSMFKAAIQQAKDADTEEEFGQAFMMPIMMIAMSGMFESDGDDGGDFEIFDEEDLPEESELLGPLEGIEE